MICGEMDNKLSEMYRTEAKKNYDGSRDTFVELWNKKKGVLVYIPLKDCGNDGVMCVGVFKKSTGSGVLVYSYGSNNPIERTQMNLHEFKKRYKIR